jgi:preprotein translocase subunit YajC
VFVIIWLVLIAVVFYVLLWRPQQRRMSAVRRLQAHLKTGDDVITTSGIFGRIVELRDDDLRLEIAPGTVVRVARGAIGERLTVDPEPDPNDRTE